MTGHKYLHRTMAGIAVVGIGLISYGSIDAALAQHPANPGCGVNYEPCPSPARQRQTRDWTIYGPPGQQETVEIVSNASDAERLAILRDVRRRHGWP
jgi:hypothetical protein